jgi:lysophospholipase L1-like esterase
MRTHVGAALIFALATLVSAWADENSPAPKGITGAPCPEQSSPTPEYQQILEKFLTPGKLEPSFFRDMATSPETKVRLAGQREQMSRDWANLCRYRAENLMPRGPAAPEVVYLGDSITDNWKPADPGMFSPSVLNRGISGQTSPQLLLRFYQDVISLHPRIVHIMIGTNDIAGNTGPSAPGDYENNIRAMLDLALANRIRVVLAAIPPSRQLPWAGVDPRPEISRLNAWIAAEAKRRGVGFIDYSAVLAAADGSMAERYSNDGVHPNRAGYALMRPLAERAVRQALHGQ